MRQAKPSRLPDYVASGLFAISRARFFWVITSHAIAALDPLTARSAVHKSVPKQRKRPGITIAIRASQSKKLVGRYVKQQSAPEKDCIDNRIGNISK